MLQQARDEAHRFAITFQRKRRTVRTITSELLQDPGRRPEQAPAAAHGVRQRAGRPRGLARADRRGAGVDAGSARKMLDALAEVDPLKPCPQRLPRPPRQRARRRAQSTTPDEPARRCARQAAARFLHADPSPAPRAAPGPRLLGLRLHAGRRQQPAAVCPDVRAAAPRAATPPWRRATRWRRAGTCGATRRSCRSPTARRRCRSAKGLTPLTSSPALARAGRRAPAVGEGRGAAIRRRRSRRAA